AEDGIRDRNVTGVQTCALPIYSESPEALFAHTAGLRVVSPASPADAFTMIQQAISTPDPVLFLEPKARYWEKAEVPATVPEQARSEERGVGGQVGGGDRRCGVE